MASHQRNAARASRSEKPEPSTKRGRSPGNSLLSERLTPPPPPSPAGALADVGGADPSSDPATPGDLFSEATAGTGRPVPYAEELGAAFGINLGDVSAHLGQRGALGGLRARAATDGRSIAFADTSPDKSTVAHEVAHIAQQRQSGRAMQGVHPSSTVSRPGDASEVEADQAASDVLAGRTPTVSEAPGAGMLSLEPDPRPYVPAPALATTQRAADFHDTFTDNPSAPAPVEHDEVGHDTNMNITLEHDRQSALAMGVGDAPAEEHLFTVVDREPVCTPGTIAITQKFGSPEAPNVRPVADDTGMYINGTPQIADLKQGNVGDCWLLAALSSVVARDPNKVKSMMSFTPSSVSATFYHFDNSTPPGAWVPVTISTANTLLHYEDPADPTATYELVGAPLRRADAPTSTLWYGHLRGTGLYIVRRDVYEVALWAPMLEKLYAQFTEAFGQYGGAPGLRAGEDGGVGTTTSGYENIGGGWEDEVYPVFYGGDVLSHGQEDINYTPNTNPVLANQGAIANLLRAIGTDVPDGQRFLLTVDLDEGSAVERLRQLIDFVVGDRDSRRYPTLRTAMQRLGTLAVTFQNAASGTPEEAAALQTLARSARLHARPQAWPMLSSPNALPRYTELHEALHTIMNLGTDKSEGQRNTYADHSYPVLDAAFVGVDGAPLPLTLSTLAAQLPNVDPCASTVQLRNPHGRNEPNLPSTARDANPEDGVFRLTLDQYLRDFAKQQVATVNATPAPTPAGATP